MPDTSRKLSLFAATSLGLGATIGGGIIALAGVAFSVAGPSAILAFALNGFIALLAIYSFTDLVAAFPYSGGTYTFSKRVLNVHTAFIIGWIVWFAAILASTLFALGFGVYGTIILKDLLLLLGQVSLANWLTGGITERLLALLACLYFTFSLLRQQGGGGNWTTYAKVLVFALLVLLGFWGLWGSSPSKISQGLQPFMPMGFLGVFQAMGFSFITVQGFSLIATVAGALKEPRKTLPRAMLLSLAVALLIYIPLLFISTTLGLADGQDIVSLSKAQPEIIIALAAKQFIGDFGYWLVMLATVLTMLSALQANLFSASRMVFAMAKDRTLASLVAQLNTSKTPLNALYLSSFLTIFLLFILRNLAIAGAAASLIFLLNFALVHLLGMLTRWRSSPTATIPFQRFGFPFIPLLGGLTCLSLAIFQGIVVPSAGIVILFWLSIGLSMYAGLFAHQARVADASAEALDPSLIQYRGRSPLVLLPIANPNNAQALIEIAHALSPKNVGRVLLLSVVQSKQADLTDALSNTQSVLGNSLKASFELGLYPEALTTIAEDAWQEIARISKLYHCESMLLGFSELTEHIAKNRLTQLLSEVDCDVVMLRAPSGWSLAKTQRILVATASGSQNDPLRARLLASLLRISSREISYLCILPTASSETSVNRAQKALEHFANQEVSSAVNSKILQSDQSVASILAASKEADLLILGSRREGRLRMGMGDFAKTIAQQANCAVMIISRRV